MRKKCAVCSSADTGFLAQKNSYNFDRCGECGFIYLNPMPAQHDLDLQYKDSRNEPEPVCNKAASRLRRALIKLPRFFLYAYGQDTLDLGCGGGFVTFALSLVAKSSTGVDLSSNAIAYARSRFKRPCFICCNFTELLNSGRQYGFIYSSELIEHVSDVNLYMQTLDRLAAPHAHVYITTPDSGHTRVPADIRTWEVFNPPVHVQFFNRKSAAILFEKHGFSIVKFYKNRKPGLVFLARKN
jgi:2-polyprenyl-3-methyl-5-hydroxy-6-metoxy-1,4-benzoquinol methylase